MTHSLLFVNAKAEPPCFKAVKEALGKSQGFEVMEVGSFAEAATLLQNGWSGLVVLVVGGKDELLGAVNFLASQGVAIRKSKTIRVMAFNQLPGSKVLGALTSLGCAETLDFSVTSKAMLHKVQRHFKLIRSFGAKSEPSAQESAAAEEKESLANDAGVSQAGGKVQIVDPLKLVADFWLTREKPDVRWMMGRWHVELIGPGPSVGAWIPLPRKENGKKGFTGFEWRSRGPEGLFAPKGGRWIFFGRNVEFVSRTGRWRFTGERVSLSYYEGETPLAHRFIAESGGVLKVAGNSMPAKARACEIEKSIAESAKTLKKSEGKDGPQTSEDQVVAEGGDRDATEGAAAKDFKHQEGLCTRKELELRYREERRKSKELSLERGPEVVQVWNDLSGDDEAPADWNENANDEAEPAAWGDREGEDAESADWNDTGARPDNVFNSGRGLTQGHGGSSVAYDDEELGTGADAFKPTGLIAQLDGSIAEVLVGEGSRLVVRVDSGTFQSGENAKLSIATQNLQPAGALLANCRIVRVEAEPEGSGSEVELEMDPPSILAWEKVRSTVEARQQDILRFLKLAKGA